MNDESKSLIDIYWKMYQEHCIQGRHHETQRSSVITAIIAIASVIIGLITYDRAITKYDLPLTLLLIVIGAFGATFSMKHYERFNFHMERARVHRDALDELIATNMPLKTLKTAADKTHKAKYPKLSKARLHYWWLSLGVIIAILGGILSIIAIFSPQTT